MAISDILLDRNINYDYKQLEFPNQQKQHIDDKLSLKYA